MLLIPDNLITNTLYRTGVPSTRSCAPLYYIPKAWYHLVQHAQHQGTWYLVHGTRELCHQLILPLYPACKWGICCRCSELRSRPKPANRHVKFNCWGSTEASLLYACLLFELADIIETITILSKYCTTLLINTPPHLGLLDPTGRKQQCRSLIHGNKFN